MDIASIAAAKEAMITTKPIPLMVPYVPRGTSEAVARVLSTRWIGQGPLVDEFEREFSKFMGGRASVAVNSCTSALHLAYLLAGIKPGDTVLVPLFTCTATTMPLLWIGAKIQFVDVAPDSLNMDWRHAVRLFSEKTKAMAVVHYGGAPVAPELFKMGRAPVIEDCAQAVGPWWAGARGQFACFSFQAVKHITTGDGGMLVLPESLAAKARRMRWFGIDRVAKLAGVWENDITEVGYKDQMTDMAASMGLCGLRALEGQIAYRRAMRDSYVTNLRGLDGIHVIDQDPESACWLCTVLVERREDFRKKLAAEGIESDQVHYRNDIYTVFNDGLGVVLGQFPNMDAIESKYLVIPMHMGMDFLDVERICEVIKSGW